MLQAMRPQFIDIGRQRDACEPAMSEAILAVLDHGRFVNGPEVSELEARLADYLGVDYAIGCANGTDAIQMLLRAAGIGVGDAVFVPSLTYVATAEAVSLVGAVPVFVDVDLATGNMSAESLEAAIDGIRDTAGPRPAAVLAVDLFGIPADAARLGAVARAHGLRLFFDGAQSFGSQGRDGMCCAVGDGATTSFYPSKSLGCFGDGGAIFTSDPSLAATVRGICNHGVLADSPGAHSVLGSNSRLDTMQAAVLLTKLTVFDAELKRRAEIAARYAEALGGLVDLPEAPEGTRPCWSYYAVRTDRRDALKADLDAAGVPSVVYYREATHLQPAFRDAPVGAGGLGNTEELSATMLCLPVHPYLSEGEQALVIDAITDFFGRTAPRRAGASA